MSDTPIYDGLVFQDEFDAAYWDRANTAWFLAHGPPSTVAENPLDVVRSGNDSQEVPVADQMTSTSTFGPNKTADPPTPSGLRCPSCGSEGQDQGNYVQCPTCGIRLEASPAAANEQPAVPVDQPQPAKQQDLQLIPAAEQPAALEAEHADLEKNPTTTTQVEGVGTVEQAATSQLLAPTLEATPEFKPADTPPVNDNTLETVPPVTAEPEISPASEGGREGDPTLGEDPAVQHATIDGPPEAPADPAPSPEAPVAEVVEPVHATVTPDTVISTSSVNTEAPAGQEPV
jgi:hypothetical protein